MRREDSRGEDGTESRVGVSVEEEEEEVELDLKYGAHSVIMIFTPVTICMAVVVATIASVGFYTRRDGVYLVYTPFHEETDDVGTLAWQSLANVSILLCVIAVLTVFLVLAYKYKCTKLINGWLILSSFLLLFLFSFLYCSEVIKSYNLPMDWITFTLCMWNFGVMGMIVVHWKGPLLLQQMYLIFISALMALIFIKYLPDWTTWAVLAVISLWDLFAVLSPCGPLRILVETAQERNEQIFPSLIYSAGVIYSLVGTTTTGDEGHSVESSQQAQGQNQAPTSAQEGATAGRRSDSDTAGFDQDWVRRSQEEEPPRRRVLVADNEAPPRAPPRGGGGSRRGQQAAAAAESGQQREPLVVNNEGAEQDRGIKLGLGDFIFYSILVGKASSYGDWNTTIACFVAILIGLCLTLMCLASFRKALPALPISIFFGLIFYFLTTSIITPFTDAMTTNQIFI